MRVFYCCRLAVCKTELLCIYRITQCQDGQSACEVMWEVECELKIWMMGRNDQEVGKMVEWKNKRKTRLSTIGVFSVCPPRFSYATLILMITKGFINSKCKHKGFFFLIPWCSFYFYDSCSFPAECYFQGSQFMRFRREQCFGSSQIWLKKYKTLSEVVTRRPRNARNRAYDQYSSPFLVFLLREKKHFHTLPAFVVLMLNCQRCLILSVNSKLSEAPLWLWSAVLSTVWWDGGCFVLLQTSGASARRHRGWLAAV